MGTNLQHYIKKRPARLLWRRRAYMACRRHFWYSNTGGDAINGLWLYCSPNDIWMAYWFRDSRLLEALDRTWLLRNTREEPIQSRRFWKTPYKPGVGYYSSQYAGILNGTQPSTFGWYCRRNLFAQKNPADLQIDSHLYLTWSNGLILFVLQQIPKQKSLDSTNLLCPWNGNLELHWLRHKASEVLRMTVAKRRAKQGLKWDKW